MQIDCFPLKFIIIIKARKTIIKFDYYSYEIDALIVIVISYKNCQHCYQIFKITIYFFEIHRNFKNIHKNAIIKLFSTFHLRS